MDYRAAAVIAYLLFLALVSAVYLEWRAASPYIYLPLGAAVIAITVALGFALRRR